MVAYITIANVLDHTTMVVPVTRVDKDIDKFDKDYSTTEEADLKTWESCRL